MGIVSQEKLEDCKEKIKFEYDLDKIKETIDAVAKDIGRNHKIKGYRKGKAPLEAVKQVAKKYIMDTAKQKLVSESFEDILYENKWKPFGQPKVVEVLFNNKNFNIELEVGHAPSFDLVQYKDFELEKPSSEMTVESFKEKMKEGLCKEFGDLHILDDEDFVLLGDEVCISYTGTIDGEEFKNNTGKDVKFIVGSGKALDGLEDEIVGMSVNEVRKITLTFPETFPQKEVAGKECEFEVTLDSAMRKEPAEFGEEVVSKAGFKDMDLFDKTIEMKANEKIEEFEFVHYRAKINEKLLEVNQIAIPDWMKTEIANSLARMQNKKWEELSDDEKTKMLLDSEKKLMISFILDYIKEKEVEAVMSQEEVISTINANMHRFPANVKDQLAKGSNPHLMSQVSSEIQDEYLMRWLINQSVKDSKLNKKVEDEVENKEENKEEVVENG